LDDFYLIIFHVGPVQEFIAAARRSRDLWFGSWLLSELSKAAAREVVKHNDGNVECLVFPAPQNYDELKNEDFCCPNKIVALIRRSPAELGKRVHEALQKRLSEIFEDTFNRINGDILRKTARQQVDDLLEYYWSAYPIHDNYSRALKYAEALMTARKTTRDFKAVQWGKGVPKSSLDGQRESVIPEKAYDYFSEEQLRKKYGVRKGERLCGIGLLKRNGSRGQRDRSDRFPSTSHVAALPLLERLKDQDAVREYIQTLRSLGISSDLLGTMPRRHSVFAYNDGHLLYEERLKEFFNDSNKIEQAAIALQTFLKKALEGKRPLPYYALLLADGDNMGKVINGLDHAEKHRKFSQRLSRFATRVNGLIEKFRGSLVYSGGDDVLAFVPLHTVLHCAHVLSNLFYRELAHFQVLEEGKTLSPSLSVGIAVVHHLDPLSDALNLARSAEKTAKKIDGKNALAISINKRSGSDYSVAGKWPSLYGRFNSFINLHRAALISDSAAYELRDLALSLQFTDINEGSEEERMLVQQIIQKEALRILRHKEAGGGQNPIREDILLELERHIMDRHLSVGQLANELIIARLFAESIEQSGIEPEKLMQDSFESSGVMSSR